MSEIDMAVTACVIAGGLMAGVAWFILTRLENRRDKRVEAKNEKIEISGGNAIIPKDDPRRKVGFPKHKHRLKYVATPEVAYIPQTNAHLLKPYLMCCRDCGKYFWVDRKKFLGKVNER